MTDAAAQPQEAPPAPTNASADGHAIVLPGQMPDGQPILSVLLKRTYDIVAGRPCARAAEDVKLISGDVHYKGPMDSSVQFESDFVPFKLAADVVINGRAYAAGGKPVPVMVAAAFVGQARKDVMIIGDRLCHYRRVGGASISDPVPFASMELTYERAYGGVDVKSDPDMQCLYPRNHLGKGFAVTMNKEAIDNLPLPNLEDPRDLITLDRLVPGHFKDWEKQPFPQSFGWVAKFWRPRGDLAGVMPGDREVEEQLREAYAQAVPDDQKDMYEKTKLRDMDFRFFNGASPGLVHPSMVGNEQVRLIGFDPNGDVRFQLPGEKPKIGLDIGEGVQEPDVVIHTVMIRMDERQVDMVYRGAVPYRGTDWLPEMKKMEVLAE